MRIICPSCHAAYEVPDTLVAGGKVVRCAKCAAEWAPSVPASTSRAGPPPMSGPASPPVPETAPSPAPAAARRGEPRLAAIRLRGVDSLDDARPPPRDDEIELAPRRRGALVAWLLSLLLLAALVWAALAFRAEVMGAWPPSERLYAALGLR